MSEKSESSAKPAKGQTSYQRNRLSQGMRDMLMTMLVLAVIVLVLIGVRGGFSFSPGSASVDQSATPKVDASKYLRDAGRDAKYQVRVPTLPSTWRANAANVAAIGNGGEVLVGWITERDGYLRLVQSNASIDELVNQAAENSGAVKPQGRTDIRGTHWSRYPAVRNEQSWVASFGSTHVLITGNASTEQFETLAAAVGSAPIAARRS